MVDFFLSTPAHYIDFRQGWQEVFHWCDLQTPDHPVGDLQTEVAGALQLGVEFLRAAVDAVADGLDEQTGHARAVGGEEIGSGWYEGMLHTDNVHPNELGAKALYAQFIADFPEILGE